MTLGLIAGIVGAHQCPLWLIMSILLVSLSLTAVVYKNSTHRVRNIAAFMVAGMILGVIRYIGYESAYQRDKAMVSAAEGDIVAVVQNIYHTPEKQWPLTIRISLKQLFNNHKQSTELSGDISIYCNQAASMLPGDTILVKKPRIIPCSDTKTIFFKKEGIVGSVFCKKPRVTIINRPCISLQRWSYLLLQRITQNIASKSNKRTAELFNTFFLGAPSNTPAITTTKKQYQLWGIAHYMARSGLHLMIIVWLLMCLGNIVPLHQRYKNVMYLIVIILYSVASWASTSFMRALWTFFISRVAQLFMIDMQSIELITLVTALFLVYNPLMIFFADFQLSFLLTYGLISHHQPVR